MLFPDAVQRVALAQRCTAEPGSFQTPELGTVPGLQRTTISAFTRVFDALWKCCAAPGTSVSNYPEALALFGQQVDLALGELAVAHDLAEVILQLRQDVDRLPQPLARVG